LVYRTGEVMAKFRIAGPDGATYEVTAPDTATEEEVLAYVKQNAQAPQSQPAPAMQSDNAGFLKDALLTSIPGRAVKGAKDFVDAGAQMLSQALGGKEEAARVSGDIGQSNTAYEAARARMGQSGVDIPRMGGAAAATMVAGRGLPMPASLGGKLAMGAGQGAAFGAMQPVFDPAADFWKEKGKQTAMGAATGAASVPVAAGLSRLIAPQTAPAVRKLMDEGITPTPGQVLGGAFKSAEEKLGSVPILGSAIRSGQQRGVEQLNEVAINRAIAPIGVKLPKGTAGRDAVQFAEDALGSKYDAVLNQVGAKPMDGQLVADMSQLSAMLNQLPKEAQDKFVRILKNEVADRFQNGYLTGEGFKAAESNLGQVAGKLLGSSDYDERTLGQAVKQAQANMRSWLDRNAGQQASELAKVNEGWANFKRIQNASARTGNDNGVFTPAQLSAAVKATDRSKDKAAFARGNALMQDLSDPAREVLMNKVPNSGTADRLLAAGLTGGLGTGALTLSPWLALPTVASAAYAPGVQRLVANALSTRPTAAQPLAEGVKALSPIIGGGLFGGLLSQ
jgi:hypothetical protein